MIMIGEDSSSSKVSVDYISAAANRYARAAHQSGSSLVAFGSSSFIALWDASGDKNSGIYQTLPGHDGLVTCVRFKAGEDCFFSTDDRGYLKCWRLHGSEWLLSCSVQAHTKAIFALGVHGNCIATGSSDGSVEVWKHIISQDYKDELVEIQRIEMKGRYPLDIQIATLPQAESSIMAVSVTERNVLVFTRSDEKFVRAASLPGHEDWVKSLAFKAGVASPSILTLASGSQDGTVRLWNIERITKEKTSSDRTSDILSDELLDSFEAALGDVTEGEEGGRQISMKRHVFGIVNKDGSSSQYSITFDALLVGHEAGVTSLVWRPSSQVSQQPTLLSTSTDSSLILWSPTSNSITGGVEPSLWINHQRFGDIGGQRLGGFVGAIWTNGGLDAVAWGWRGGWRRWRFAAKTSISDPGIEMWEEINAISGHEGPVKSVSWSRGGEYLISTGPDQTTRIHGSVNAKEAQEDESWHELCRPQVHGYDLSDAVFLSPSRFLSIADEKVARVFDAPQSFMSLCTNLGILADTENKIERPAAVSVPPLGLSNKALSGADSTESRFPLPSESMTRRCPFEGELAISTLWPEVEKLFGHGYELHALAVSHSGKYIATSCRATTPEHAGIKIHETTSWQLYGQTLQGHQLTVTRIAFSPDDRYILSVSRDRTWNIYEASENGFVHRKSEKAHARIIWDCAWAHEQDVFATASRDKTVRVWLLRDLAAKKQTPIFNIKTKEAATAVAFNAAARSGSRLMAVGLENGEINIYSGSVEVLGSWNQHLVVDASVAHVGQIHRVEWRPRGPRDEDAGNHQIATCSEDGTVRIIRIQI